MRGQPGLFEVCTRTTDEVDTGVPGKRSCGRSQASLYNTARPHSSLGYRPPAPEAIMPRSGPIAPWATALAVGASRSPTSTVVSGVPMH